MKKSVTTLLAIIAWVQVLHSQNCTQCDNTGNPPGNYASEIGIGTTANGEASFAGGYHSIADGNLSFSFGAHSIAEGTSSFSLGQFLQTTASQSMVIGIGASLSNKLTNGITKSLMIGFGSEKPTLFVGPTGPGLTGKIGIGDVTNPQSKLHIKADNGEAAEVFIEPFISSGTATLWLGNKEYGVRRISNLLEFKTGAGGVYYFNDGNIGVGTTSPSQKLEVSGNLKTTGFIMVGGAGAGKVLTSDASGQAAWTDSQWTTSGNNIYKLNGNVGIGTYSPSQRLDVNGNLKATGFMMPTGAGSGKVLTSDVSGNATWANTHWTASGSSIYRSTGNVGIGTTWPLARLVVSHTASADTKIAEFIDSENRKIFFVPKLNNSGYSKISSDNDAGIFWSDGSGSFGQNLNAGFVIAPHKDGDPIRGISIDYQGNVGIGKKSSPLARLDVNGTVKASAIEAPSMSINTMTISTLTVTSKLWAAEIEVTNLAGWKDYVFDDDYPLMPLSQVEAFIMENRHLPGIPSEKEVMASGFNIAEMNAMLLQKIEELTLYVIELEKKLIK
jgi:hypothetical protein